MDKARNQERTRQRREHAIPTQGNVTQIKIQFHEERNFLLYLARTRSSRRQESGSIRTSNYAAVYTPPTNNNKPFYGPCLIWRHTLDTDGYGVLQKNGKSHKAHRVAYELSRGSIPRGKLILHLCDRRSCIQPAHLYAGTPQENTDDRRARFDQEGYWASIERFLHKDSPHIDGLKHYWDEPQSTQLTLLPPKRHKCKYTIPAGIIKLCQTCFNSEPHIFSTLEVPRFLEEESKYREYVREVLDERIVGRGPGDEPLNFIPKYRRIVAMHSLSEF